MLQFDAAAFSFLRADVILYRLPRMEVVPSAAQYERGDATLTSPYGLDRGPPTSAPPRVGRYEICEVLGAGAMGVMYRARDPELDRDVAIKLVRDSGASPSSGLR